jgi:hypothetical protein
MSAVSASIETPEGWPDPSGARSSGSLPVLHVQSPSGAIRYSAGPVDDGPCGIESIRHSEEPGEGADVRLRWRVDGS